ncbi:hypothetical protein CEW83_12575 [Parazoarcus communis]|uniref:DUF2802 domain-containing protein n=1 Tax=Parazoarcus communis TaxID=41977 RepID=A0A2U8GQH2_9RHOO|nr:DUF2802 domain-containing protein [Parazoarcus communis]AWI75949.1 hypothetical protein CEW83_12575 [Parazoarcus communis]
MGFRQLVWALIAALLIYGAWQLLRALVAGRGRAEAASPPAAAALKADSMAAEDADDDDADFNYAPLPSDVVAPAAPAAPPAPEAPAAERPDTFALELELQRLRREVGALRAALDVQQGEIGALHETVQRLVDAPPADSSSLEDSSGQNASPEYSEALVLARRGLSVEEVAARCGITRAEAELVVSLAARGEPEGGA